MIPGNPLQRRKLFTFGLTWIAYASSYLLRKPLGVVKSDLALSYNLSKTDLGWLDTALLLPYAVMQMLISELGDKYGARKALAVNLMVSGFSMITFGFWHHLPILGILLFINGTAQSTCWPNCVKGLSAWYTEEERSKVFGIWGTCTFAGGILGTAVAVQLQAIYSPDLRIIFLVPSVIVLLVAGAVACYLHTPAELNMVVPGKAEVPTSPSGRTTTQMSFYQVWKVTMVPELAFALLGVKMVRYCLYMWLPMYLHQKLHYSRSQAGILSTVFEIGGLLGSAAFGFVVDRIAGGRQHWGAVMILFGSAVSLILFLLTSTSGWLVNVLFMGLTGFCNSGPDSIISGSMAADIGDRVNAQSAVSGLINGFGGLGTIIQGPLIGMIAERYSWDDTFYVMVFLSLVSTIAMMKASKMHDRIKQEGASDVI